jgi:hypothetical protein
VRRIDQSNSAAANSPEMIKGGLADRLMTQSEPYRARPRSPAVVDRFFRLALLTGVSLAWSRTAEVYRRRPSGGRVTVRPTVGRSRSGQEPT